MGLLGGVSLGFSTTIPNRATIAEVWLNNSSIHFLLFGMLYKTITLQRLSPYLLYVRKWLPEEGLTFFWTLAPLEIGIVEFTLVRVREKHDSRSFVLICNNYQECRKREGVTEAASSSALTKRGHNILKCTITMKVL